MFQSLAKRISQVSLIFACGTALFADGYSNNVIGVVITLLNTQYAKSSATVSRFSTDLPSITFAGIIVGQLSFGYISDKVGRKFGMMAASGIVALFALLTATVKGVNGDLHSMLAQLAAWRFFLGIGIGAEYPCGSVAASEQSEEPGIQKNRQHRWVALATNTMVDAGFVLGAFVPLVLLWIFGENHLDAVWRGSLGFGLIPALAVLLWRWKMEEPACFKRDSMKHTKIPYWLVIKRYWLRLGAVSLTWFLYDFIVYPFGVFSSTVLKGIIPNPSLVQNLGLTVVINLFYMPGTIAGAFCLDYIGPKYTQVAGLLIQSVIGFIMCGAYKHLVHVPAAFAVVYGIFLSFGEFGPGNCTIVLAAKTGPTAVRGQFYAVAAAVGKVGALVGTWAFKPMVTAFSHHGLDPDRGNTGPFWVGIGLDILSALVTLLFVHPLTHDGMEREDRAFREYLEEHGYDTSKMGLLRGEGEVGSLEEKNPSESDERNVNALVKGTA